jgi:hypothetical protein
VSTTKGFAVKFSFGFTTAVMAFFMGVTALKGVTNYREQRAQTGFAVAGLLFAAISALAVLNSMTW